MRIGERLVLLYVCILGSGGEAAWRPVVLCLLGSCLCCPRVIPPVVQPREFVALGVTDRRSRPGEESGNKVAGVKRTCVNYVCGCAASCLTERARLCYHTARGNVILATQLQASSQVTCA